MNFFFLQFPLRDMQNAFHRIGRKWPEKSGKGFLWHFTTRVINCNSTFFLSLTQARCHFSRCTFYHPLQFICGVVLCNSSPAFYFSLLMLSSLPSIHLFPGLERKKNFSNRMRRESSSYFKLLMHFFHVSFFFVFLHFWQTHIHMCIYIANIHLHNFFFHATVLFLCAILHSLQIYSFFPLPARTTLFDSLMVKWLYGLVWSVVCYFNFLCLLLTALGADVVRRALVKRAMGRLWA